MERPAQTPDIMGDGKDIEIRVYGREFRNEFHGLQRTLDRIATVEGGEAHFILAGDGFYLCKTPY